ncbi:MAG: hypothetical protein A4E53_02454 [Pelotomaculum sp. PtaB.Bin104]|nr:MAG: hypothetical protein A4E53_02454 [Pelotomaculum sp. PtaB.Bin104]
MNKYRSPVLAALWSVAIPGFGQLYTGDYLIGLLLVILEFIINVNARLNLSILYSFRGQFQHAIEVTDFQWIMFYPCIYAFSIWQAYNRALELNTGLRRNEENNIFTNNKYCGFFIGVAMGGTLGVIYSFLIGPILCGILGGVAGGLIGAIIEKLGRIIFSKGQRDT